MRKILNVKRLALALGLCNAVAIGGIVGCNPVETASNDADSSAGAASSLPPSQGTPSGLPPSGNPGPPSGNPGGATVAAPPTGPGPAPNAPRPNNAGPTKPKIVPTGNVGFAPGDTAPDISGEDLNGVAFKLSDYRGKVVVLDFWGDW